MKWRRTLSAWRGGRKISNCIRGSRPDSYPAVFPNFRDLSATSCDLLFYKMTGTSSLMWPFQDFSRPPLTGNTLHTCDANQLTWPVGFAKIHLFWLSIPLCRERMYINECEIICCSSVVTIDWTPMGWDCLHAQHWSVRMEEGGWAAQRVEMEGP